MKKRNIRGFFVGEKGQRLFNYAYSIGASVVIVGALFKLLHWPFADFILIVGMGTEAAIFFLSAFDEPAKDYKWEKVYPELDYPEDGTDRPSPSLPRREEAPVAPANNVANFDSSSLQGRTEVGLINTVEVNEATEKYVAQLKAISEQMVALNRSVQGLDAIYEVQLKSASSQLGSVEQVTQQTQQLAKQLQQLNEMYGRMIQAMTMQQRN